MERKRGKRREERGEGRRGVTLTERKGRLVKVKVTEWEISGVTLTSATISVHMRTQTSVHAHADTHTHTHTKSNSKMISNIHVHTSSQACVAARKV